MSQQANSGGGDGQAAGSAGADPSQVREHTEQKNMHSKDAKDADKARKPAQSAPVKGEAHK